MTFVWTAAAVVVLSGIALAQDMDEALEDLVYAADGTTVPQDLVRLDELRQSPVDLNTATRAELEQLPWVTPQQAAAVVQWRDRYGPYSSVNTLSSVPGFDPMLVDRLRPFVTVRLASRHSRGRIRITGQHRARDSTRSTSWMRVRTDYSLGQHVAWGAQVAYRPHDRAGVYKLSGSLDLRQLSVFERIVIGQYDLEFGQGLVLGARTNRWGIRRPGVPFKWRPRGPVPARSSGQPGRFSGGVMAARWRVLRLTTVVARTKTGQRLTGTRVSWTGARATAGITLTGSTGMRSTLMSDDSASDGEEDSTMVVSDPVFAYGFDFDAMIGQTNLFGEFARGRGGGTGLAAGVLWTLGRLDGGMVIRRVDLAQGVSAGSQNFNGQSGQDDYRVTADVRFRPDDWTVLALSQEIRRRPRRSAGVSFPVAETHLAASVTRRMARSVMMTTMWRSERREDWKSAGGRSSPFRLRGQVDWNPTARMRLRGRAEHRLRRASSRATGERQRLLLADLRYQMMDTVVLAGQWVGTSGVTTTSVPFAPDDDASDGEIEQARTAHSSRWSVFLRSPIAARADLSVRYTQTRINQPEKARPRRSDVAWTIQLNVAW